MEPLEKLVEAARQGDTDAFSRIVDRFTDNAHARAYAVLGDYHLAQDAVQDAFAEAFLNLDKLREPAAFPGWFKRIVIKRIDRLIRGKKLPMTSLDEAYGVSAEEEDAGLALDQDEVSVALHQAVEALPDHERGVAASYYFNDAAQKEIADEYGVPVTTIKKRLYTSRQRLRHRLADFQNIDDAEFGNQLPLTVQLFAAARNGFVSKVQSLIKRDPDLVYAKNEDGLSILLYAAHASHHKGYRAVPEYLVAKGAPVDFRAAAALGLRELMTPMLKWTPEQVNRRAAWDRTPLHWAASGGHTTLVSWIVDRGANINQPDGWGCTPLHLAAELGHLDTVNLLLDRGADARARLKNGKTALHVAAQAGHVPVVETLLRHGANIDIFAAASLGWKERVQHILRRERDVAKVRLTFGATPLHMAAESGQKETAEYLLNQGVDLDLVGAAELGWIDQVVQMLEKAPKLVDAKGGSFGFTALHSASARGRHDLARVLLASGAEVNVTDDMYHKTPLGEALYFGNEAMARLLFQYGALS